MLPDVSEKHPLSLSSVAGIGATPEPCQSKIQSVDGSVLYLAVRIPDPYHALSNPKIKFFDLKIGASITSLQTCSSPAHVLLNHGLSTPITSTGR